MEAVNFKYHEDEAVEVVNLLELEMYLPRNLVPTEEIVFVQPLHKGTQYDILLMTL